MDEIVRQVKLAKSIIGNCYKYREKYTDKYFCYLKVISARDGTTTFVNTHLFKRNLKYDASNKDSFTFFQSTMPLGNVEYILKITQKEFDSKVSEYLKEVGLQFIPRVSH